MANIIFSEYVESEVTAIWEFIAADDIGAADRFLESLENTLNQLAQMPEMGRIRNFQHARLHNLRSFSIDGYRNYLIFYSPIHNGIEVFHVIHGARELNSFFDTD